MKAMIVIFFLAVAMAGNGQAKKDTAITDSTMIFNLKHLTALDLRLQEIVPKKYYDLVLIELQQMMIAAIQEWNRKNKPK